MVEKLYNEAETVKPETVEGEEQTEEIIKQFATTPKIISATVNTHGINYGNPEIEKAFNYEEYMYQMMNAYYGEQ